MTKDFIVPDLILTQRLTQKQAHDFFVNLDFNQLQTSSLWAEYTFRGDERIILILSNMVADLYESGYELVMGTFENNSKLRGPIVSGKAVAFWAPAEPDGIFQDDTLDYSPRNPVVDMNYPYLLVQQAFMLREGFRQGYGHRTREVRSSFAGMMGISENHLVNGILGGEED